MNKNMKLVVSALAFVLLSGRVCNSEPVVLMKVDVVTSSAEVSGMFGMEFVSYDATNTYVRAYEGPARTDKGSLWLIDGQYLLLKGVNAPKGHEIDALDSASIMFQLLIHIFAEALPQGPSAIQKKTSISLSSNRKPIRLKTNSGECEYRHPWRAKGYVDRSKDGGLLFDIEFKCSSAKGKTLDQCMKASGTREAKDMARPPDSEVIESRSQFELGRFNEGGVIDYKARPIEKPFKTLGELRRSNIQPKIKP